MATLSPSLNAIRQDTGLYRELDVLERLQESLPAGYDIFHSVAWHSVENGQDRHGEIDIVVLGPTGHLLLMEIKSGGVQLRDGELFKLYSSREHDVRRQLAVQRAALLHRLKEAGLHAFVSHCLVLPDYRLEAGDIVALSRDRIIDAADFPFLGTRVQELMRHGDSQSDIEALRRFLSNERGPDAHHSSQSAPWDSPRAPTMVAGLRALPLSALLSRGFSGASGASEDEAGASSAGTGTTSSASSIVTEPPSKRSTRTPRISEKTSSTVPTASMTTMRSGSASARRRYSWRTRSWKSMDSRSIRSGASVRRRAPTSGGRSRRNVSDG